MSTDRGEYENTEERRDSSWKRLRREYQTDRPYEETTPQTSTDRYEQGGVRPPKKQGDQDG